MSLQHLDDDAIDENALQQLVASNAAESRTLEFKQALQIATDDQKRDC